jgi:hypothetical protein
VEDREMNPQVKAETNDKLFMQMLASIDPSLWRIKNKLKETQVSGEIIPPILEAIAFVTQNTKYGTVEIVIENGNITVTKSHSWRKLDIEIDD